MSKAAHCLNCNEIVSKKFCPNCGQKTDTHRITLKHFFAHDIIHGMWHFERGILFTLKQAIVRPGQAALDYISGKRIRYYNVFYLSLLVIGLNILLLHFYDSFGEKQSTLIAEDITPDVTSFFKTNIKIILFSIFPILGTSGWLIFRRLKLNIAEHFIISGMCLLGMMQFVILFSLADYLVQDFQFFILGILKVVSFFLIVLFPIWCYWNATKGLYSFLGKCWRLLAFYLLIFIQIQLMLAVLIYFLTGGRGDFYISL